MPRRDAQVSRQQQAFEMLLDPQYAANPLPANAAGKGDRRSKKTNRTVSDKRASGKVPGFVLRESLPMQQQPTQSTAQVEQLYSMFGDSIDRSIIKHVLSQCHHSAEAAIDELLAVSEGIQSERTAGPSSGKPAQPSRPPASPSYWSWLPEECKGLVLRHLDSRDLAKAARTSKEFAEHIRTVRAGLGVLNVPPGLSPAAVRGMVAAYTGATSVSLARCAGQLRHTVDFASMFSAVSRGVAARLQGLPLLRLDLKGCIALRTDDVASLCEYFETLRGLSLRGCEDIDDTAVLILSKYTARSDLSQQLSSLSVAPSSTPDGSHPAVHNPGRAVTAVGPSIRNVSLQRTVLSNSLQSVCQAAAPKSPHQQPVLDPESSAKQTQGSRSARWEVQQHSSSIDTGGEAGLELICLAGCRVTGKGVAALLKGSPASRSLTSLDVSRCFGLSQNALDLPPKTMLKQLTANSCSGISSVTIQLPPTAPLHSISLTACRKLKQVTISAPHLEALAVDDCAQLHTLELQCPNLTALTASHCHDLFGFLPVLDCPRLQQLNLFGCAQLETEDVAETLDALPELRKLNVNGCIGLTRLRLPHCTKLHWLDCSGCALLQHLHAFSPALSHVRAVACQRLMDVSLTSEKLTSLDLRNCGQLGHLSFPELDHAMGQQLVLPRSAAPPKSRSKDCLARRVNVSGCSRLPDAVMTVLA